MNKVGMFALMIVLAGSTALSAQSKEDKSRAKAKDTVDRVRQADPPQAKERKKDDTAEKRSKEANAQEQAHQKEVAKKYPAKGRDVPSPK
ncbi:hypothetical protein [Geothrix fuzhouensis]|uniref:hypothetical protein n=1 Tax=Geothrix fuzhouensis TaxID=2966451 RepID=UPI0021476985|nr:hypothetical protein [Geothrix fuzhouensis]